MKEKYYAVENVGLDDRVKIKTVAKSIGLEVSDTFLSKVTEFPSIVLFDDCVSGLKGVEDLSLEELERNKHIKLITLEDFIKKIKA